MLIRFFAIFMCGFLSASSTLWAQVPENLTFFRIATGTIGDVYEPVGAALAHAISHPPGMPTCEKGGNCGVPGLVAVMRSSAGSLNNIRALQAGKIDAAFVQSDILYWAYEGKNMFEAGGPMSNLRVLASLFSQSIHIATPEKSDIVTIADLKGRRIAVGQAQSDTFIETQMLLNAYGLDLTDVTPVYASPFEGAELLKKGKVDALFMVTGYPSRVLERLTEQTDIRFLNLEGVEIDRLVDRHSFLKRSVIPAGTYAGVENVHTIMLPMIWVTTDRLAEGVSFQLLRALWHEKSATYLEKGNDLARQVTYGTSFDGVSIPLHKGAMAFHEELEIKKAQRLYALDLLKENRFGWSLNVFANSPKK